MADLRVYDVELYAQPPTQLRVYDVELSATLPPVELRVYDVELSGNAAPPADQTVNSRDAVTIPFPATQTAGPTVTLSGSGGTRTFVAPETVDGTLLSFTVASGSTNVAVRAHQWWVKRGAVYKTFALQFIP